MRSLGAQPMDEAACQDMILAPGGGIDRIKDAIEAERVTFISDTFSACIEAINNISCSGDLNADACDQIFAGTVEQGGGCFIDEECLDGDGVGSCSASDNQCGICEVNPDIPDANQGESCAQADCAAGLECNEEDICQPEAEASGSAGSTCESDGPTDVFGGCDMSANLLCIDGTCTEASFTSSAGAECGANGVMCEGDLVCPISTSASTVQCTAPKAVGESCIDGSEQSLMITACVSTAFCNYESRQCVAKKDNGEMCDEDGHCQSGNCDEMSEVCSAQESEPQWQSCD